MTEQKRVLIFSSGSQYRNWIVSNCELCTKYDPEDFATCEIDEAIRQAYYDDGTVTEAIAKRAGYTEPNQAYVWKCGEVEWTEAWKAEKAARE